MQHYGYDEKVPEETPLSSDCILGIQKWMRSYYEKELIWSSHYYITLHSHNYSNDSNDPILQGITHLSRMN